MRAYAVQSRDIDAGSPRIGVRKEADTTEQIWATREEWLAVAVDTLRPIWKDRAGLDVPQVRVGVGFPSGGLRSSANGQTWTRAVSRDNLNEITIRVTVDDPVEVLAILGHELIHAAYDCKGGHGLKFQRAWSAVGYVGSPKGSAPSDSLRDGLKQLADALGPYPGDSGLAVEAERKKQGTRMIRCQCEECGFTFRTTEKWIALAGYGLSCPDRDCDGDVKTG